MTRTADATKKPFKLDLHGAFLRRTDLSHASLVGANFRGADFSYAIFRGADFKDADLDGTILNGADLTDAKNLTVAQLRAAVVDAATKLPAPLSLADILGTAASTDHPN